MLHAMIWVLMLAFATPRPAAQVAEDAGASCERGCIVGADGWVYEVTRDDLVWTARMANCEIGSHLDTEDAPATMWAIVQNFYRRHLVGRTETLSFFVSHYSGCTSPIWATGGTKYSPRITPLADANRKTRWRDLPQGVRDFVWSFLRGEIPNQWAGWVYVFTRGWERFADRRWVGPFAATEDSGRSLNSYWKDPMTDGWTDRTVQIVPATRHPEINAEALPDSAR